MKRSAEQRRLRAIELKRRQRLDPATSAKWKARDNRRRHEREAKLKAEDPSVYAELRRKLNARSTAWRQANREKVSQYRSQQPDVKNAAKRAWRDKNREYCRAQARERYRREKREDPEYNLTLKLDSARARAKRKGLAFNLTIDDIVVPEFCPILGLKLEWATRTGRGLRDAAPALDRIVNSEGYVKGNVQVISTRANRWKADMTLEAAKRLVAYMELHALLA